MSINNQRNSEDQEVDLSVLTDKAKGFFQGINTAIFQSIQFAIRNIVILGILFTIGVGLGLYLDKTNKEYDHQMVVQPNFGSTDYLYSKIDLIQSKIKENDTVFLKGIGIKEPKNLIKIEVKPVIDVYQFINSNSSQNFELLKLMAEDGDMKKTVEERMTSKNYTFHLISFKTKGIISHEKIIDPILSFLNDSCQYILFEVV